MQKWKTFLNLFIFCVPTLVVSQMFWPDAWPAEKLRFATPTKTTPHHNLPPLAAEEQGFWKQNGLEVEWTPFNGDTPMFRALAGGYVDMGVTATPGPIQAVARGIPALIVADTHLENYRWFLYVLRDSRVKEAKDLKRARVAVNIFGGTAHAYGRVAVKGLGLEKEVRFVAAGGVAEQIAALKSGAVDATVLPLFAIAPLKFRGEVREAAEVTDHLPQPWSDHIIFAGKDYAQKKGETVRRAIKALIQATDFIQRDSNWTTAKMVSLSGFPEEVARKMVPLVRYGKEWKIDPKAMENVKNFMLEYGIIDKGPAAEELYSLGFAR